MKFLLDRDNELSCIDDIKIPDDEKIFQGWVYHPNPDHRGDKNSGDKSKWTITVDEEGECFVSARKQDWIEGNRGWGLHFVNENRTLVGSLADSMQQKNRTSWIAKFIDGTNTLNWHGWPADTKLKVNDRPLEKVLQDWIDKRYISKAERRKIIQGKL